MIVKNYLDSYLAVCPKKGFQSNRYLLENDGMGFTLTRTRIPVNGKQFWHYKNHLEACYCFQGHGILTNAITEEEFEIKPGTMYALDNHDPHFFEAIEEVYLICVFTPPLIGGEIHNEDGSYEVKNEKI